MPELLRQDASQGAGPRGSLKPLPCPVCRVVTEVERGRADSLLKNFPLLR